MLLMPLDRKRKTKARARGKPRMQRSQTRNDVEHSAQIFCAECSTRWPSAQYFRSIIRRNYQLLPIRILFTEFVNCVLIESLTNRWNIAFSLVGCLIVRR